MWHSIKAFYPSSCSGWDAEPPLIWAHVLNDLSYDQLANGVKNLVHHRDQRGGNDFPPNAGQFRDLCLSNFNWEAQCHKYFEPETLIEDITGKEKRREVALSAVTGLRSMFGGRREA